MKWLIRIEGFAYLSAGTAAYNTYFDNWWLFAALFLYPDIGMLGYAVNSRMGAICYNLFHHLLSVLVLVALGYFADVDWLIMLGVIMLAHIGFDRVLGYGLKYPDAFKNTHLDKF
jgi:hypothetical protein